MKKVDYWAKENQRERIDPQKHPAKDKDKDMF